MPLFRDDKDAEKIGEEIKKYAEVLYKLSDEVKLLRKEVEFLSDLAKGNEENILKQKENIQDVDGKLKKLFEILEVNEEDI